MGCEQWRDALSARLDGETDPGESAQVDAHIGACGSCRAWWDEAATITRLVRTSQVVPGPDVTDVVVAAAPGPGRARLAMGLRAMLSVLGAAQLVLGLMQVAAWGSTGGHLHGGAVAGGASPDHLWHESAAWNLAIGAGYVWVAARRSRPTAIVPILTVFVAVLALLSIGDVAAGRVEPIRLASHGFVLAGYLIVVALTRPTLTMGDPPAGGGRRAGRWHLRLDPADQPTLVPPTRLRRRVGGGTATGHGGRRQAA
ncbi:MAG TPA: zf-HC2 domain-containing protein [Micromonosporaceae bacterium]